MERKVQRIVICITRPETAGLRMRVRFASRGDSRGLKCEYSQNRFWPFPSLKQFVSSLAHGMSLDRRLFSWKECEVCISISNMFDAFISISGR
jgi:hypothetical protein